jgi:threonine/homoserine/homoserine lactone efflux protein
MLGIEGLWLFIISGLLLNITPGPDTAYIVGRSVQLGWRGGVAAALGVGAGCLVHVFGGAAGLSALLAASSGAFTLLKWAGAAYLCFIGARMLLSRPQAHARKALAQSAAVSLRQVFLQGALTNALNPKVALFFLAFLPQFVDPARGAVHWQILILGLTFMGLGVMSDGVFALVAGAAGDFLRRNRRFLRFQRWFAGISFIGLGVTAALATRK